MKKGELFLLLLCLSCLQLAAKLPKDIPLKGLQGFWSFTGNANDESGNGHKSRVSGAQLSTDRFGHRNGAYTFNGNSDFIATDYKGVLGAHPRAVSFWARTNVSTRPMPVVAWGANSLHPTKGTRFDCGFNYEEKGATLDVSDAALTFEAHNYTHDGEWHHYVYQFSVPVLKKVEIYQDGVRLTHEELAFYPYTDLNTVYSYPVHFGTIVFPLPHAYFFEGQLDDIAIYDRALTKKEISALYHAPDPSPDLSKLVKKWLLIGLGIAVLLLLISLYIRVRIRKALRIEMEKNYLRNNSYEQQNKVLMAQMDPHFIFNSLNTIQQFIVTNDNEKAQRYLHQFSRLMRKMLESNLKDSISLEEEIDLFEEYLEIESLRFDSIFNYKINLPQGLDTSTVFIPHFLIQPFIENAIWHALLPKPGHKQIDITFNIIDPQTLSCTIDDNGIGRKSSELKHSARTKKSLAINFIEQRLSLLSKIKNKPYGLLIVDKTNAAGESEGTKVTVTMPIM